MSTKGEDSDQYAAYFREMLSHEYNDNRINYEKGLAEENKDESLVVEGCYLNNQDKWVAKSLLPANFCLDILIKYSLHDYALEFLFYRREFKELLHLIRT